MTCSPSRSRILLPAPRADPDDQSQPVPLTKEEAIRRYAYRYQAPVPIRPAPKRPLYLSVLKPKPGASTIPLGEASPHLAGGRAAGRPRADHDAHDQPERRVPARLARARYAGSPGRAAAPGRADRRRGRLRTATSRQPPQRGRLLAADLSWYRIMSRDADLATAPIAAPAPIPDASGRFPNGSRARPGSRRESSSTARPAWPIGATGRRLPKLSKDLLDEASGITIPSSNFVLRVILAYLIAVIPLNWLICRFVLNRREWTWVVVPLVALAFAIGVERVAARDIGYDTAADEIDLLEIHGDYPRGHLTPTGLVVLDRAIALHHLVPQRPDGAGPAVRQRPVDPW